MNQRLSSQLLCTTGKTHDRTRQVGFTRRLQMRRIAIVPTSIKPPKVPYDELRIVINGTQIRPLEQAFVRHHARYELVERCALVHELQRLPHDVLEKCSRIRQSLPHSMRAQNRRTMTREKHFRTQLIHAT